MKLDTIEREDLETLRNWRNDPKVKNWCRQVGLIDRLSQEKWYLSLNDNPSVKMFSIKNPETVGVCGLTSITPVHNSAEFSIYIAPEYRRRGMATQALKLLLKFGFDEFNLNRIWGETFDENPGMVLYEFLGFKKEGTLRETYFKNGEYLNSHIYGITKKDYQAALFVSM